MVISQPPGNNHYYRASPMPPQLLLLFLRHLMFYTCNYNIRVTHRNGATYIYTNQIRPRGSSADCSLFILSLHALALHLVEILLQIFLYEDLSTLAHTSVGCISLQNASRTALCYATNTIMKTFLIFDINHQQNTRRSDQIETIKTIMPRALVIAMEGFTNGSGCHF